MTQEDNFNTIKTLIESRAKANWTDTDIAYQDIVYKPQKDRSYIALNVLFGESENIGLTTMNVPDAPIRENGVLLIECYTRINRGNTEVLAIAGKIRELYQNQQFDDLVFYAGSVVRVGEANDFLQYNVSIDFYYQ